MKLSFLEIKKFRSIDFCQININQINAVVGQNNCGKSAIIRALNSFFNLHQEENSFYNGNHNYKPNTSPKITVKFSHINNPALDRYKNNDVIEIQLEYKPSTKKLTYRYKKDGKFQQAPEELMSEVKNNIAFVYIPPNRSPKELKWEENALIKQLIEEYLKSETARRDTLTPKFRSAIEFLEDGALKKISKEIGKIYSLRHQFDFTLNFDKDANFLSFLSGIKIRINELGIEHLLEDCGTGLQSLTIVVFHRILAKLKHKNIILGLEEPETNLHPQAQRELINSIKHSSESEDAQLIITTHSTVLIDNIKHEDIILVRKESDTDRGFKSQVYKINNNFFNKYDIEEFKYYQFHLYRNSDFFFANHIILVESKNDTEVIKKLASLSGINLDLYGISIVNFDGVKNLTYPLFVIKELKIPYLIILDKDYFIPYLNDNLASSRDSQGLPKYRFEYKTGIILDDLIPNPRNQTEILNTLKTNHSKTLNLLEKHNIICMKYSLEIDLLCSNAALSETAKFLNLTGEKATRHAILTSHHKRIKNLDVLLNALDNITTMNLPNSYKRIKNKLSEIVKDY